MINPIDRDDLRQRVRRAEPFRSFCIDDFLEPQSAEQVLAAFPSYEEALKVGRSFSAVNERGKVQVTDSQKFAAPLAELNRELAAPEFLGLLSYVFDIVNLLATDQLVGGGIHQTVTSPSGNSIDRLIF